MQSNLPSNFNDGDIVDYLDGKSYPGTSTHHTGRAIDICVNNDSFGGCLNKSYWTSGNGKIVYAWLKENDWLSWPALPWTATTVGAFLLGYQLNGNRLGLLGGIGALYISVFGNYVPSIQTLSFVLITTPICFVLGL